MSDCDSDQNFAEVKKEVAALKASVAECTEEAKIVQEKVYRLLVELLTSDLRLVADEEPSLEENE